MARRRGGRRSDRQDSPGAMPLDIATPDPYRVLRADIEEYERRRRRRELIDAYWESLPEVDDRRRWHPVESIPGQDRVAVYKPAQGRVAGKRLVLVPRAAVRPSESPPGAFLRLFSPPARVAFDRPRSVAICVRRNIRRRILHALGVAGGSPKHFKRRRRDAWSAVGC